MKSEGTSFKLSFHRCGWVWLKMRVSGLASNTPFICQKTWLHKYAIFSSRKRGDRKVTSCLVKKGSINFSTAAALYSLKNSVPCMRSPSLYFYSCYGCRSQCEKEKAWQKPHLDWMITTMMKKSFNSRTKGPRVYLTFRGFVLGLWGHITQPCGSPYPNDLKNAKQYRQLSDTFESNQALILRLHHKVASHNKWLIFKSQKGEGGKNCIFPKKYVRKADKIKSSEAKICKSTL